MKSSLHVRNGVEVSFCAGLQMPELLGAVPYAQNLNILTERAVDQAIGGDDEFSNANLFKFRHHSAELGMVGQRVDRVHNPRDLRVHYQQNLARCE